MEQNPDSGKVGILVAEDSPTQALNVQFLLERNGFKVTVARNGEEALRALESGPLPGLILTDIVMPRVSGYELCRRVKNDARLADIPVVLLTTLSDPLDVIEGLKCGADSFVVKPYNQDFLLSRIRYILENRTLHQAQGPETGIEVFFAGQKHTFTSRRSQMLSLLLSTFENAIQKNIELLALNKRLMEAEQQLRAQAEELRALSLTDGLTGLFNRRGFSMIASKQIEIANRDGQYMWLLFVDVDGLKPVNDVLGHEAGDRLISDVGLLLKQTCRESDIVVRLGGDEFLVLLVRGSEGDAQRLESRIQEAAARHNETAGRPYIVSFSVGIAEYNPEAPTSLEDLIRRADAAMYQEKNKKSADVRRRTIKTGSRSV